MRCALRFAAALAVACVHAAAASAEVVDVAWDSSGRFEHALSIPAGKFAEVCGKLAKDARIRWEFTAERALDFNVHYHVGKDVVYPAQQNAVARAAGELVAPVDQDYCWMWTNKAAEAARLTVKLAR